MILSSDFHIHSEASYDANIPVKTIVKRTRELNITEFGISDHVNSPSWLHYLEKSKQLFLENKIPGFHLGVELTVISANQVVMTGSTARWRVQRNIQQWCNTGYSACWRTQWVGVEYIVRRPTELCWEEEESFIKTIKINRCFGTGLKSNNCRASVGTTSSQEGKDRNGAMTRFLWHCSQKYAWWIYRSLKENGKFMEMNRHFLTRKPPESLNAVCGIHKIYVWKGRKNHTRHRSARKAGRAAILTGM